MNFIFEQIPTGGDRNFAYLIGDRSNRIATIVDPSFNPDAVIERARVQSLMVKYIINTHGHSDHINGNVKAKQITGAPIAAYKGALPAPDIALDNNISLMVGNVQLNFFHAPGHANDHIVIWLPTQHITITGDILFVGKIGGTWSEKDAHTEWNSLQFLLNILPEDATIWPGHDYGCRPSSTIALEKLCNPFLQCKDIKEFLCLKNEWTEFKLKHGLK